jgi:hypothetical protein
MISRSRPPAFALAVGMAATVLAFAPWAGAAGEDAAPAPETGLAARFPGDAGIARHPAVLFADDFESWSADGTQPPPKTWDVRRNQVSRTRAVPGAVAGDDRRGPGRRILEIACWTPGKGSQTGGLSRKLGNYNHRNEGLGPGYQELFVRYYLKFDEAYRSVRNHGANLGGRDLTRTDPWWVGMAGIRDVSTKGYFFSGVQPYAKRGSRTLEMGFYSYHLDKKTQWGENYKPLRAYPIEVGTWHCVERRMKLNSVDPSRDDPALADGIETLWIDGIATIRKTDVRFRRTKDLRITFFSLETYYHGLPERYTRENPIKVYVDHVVIAREYVGPLRQGR